MVHHHVLYNNVQKMCTMHIEIIQQKISHMYISRHEAPVLQSWGWLHKTFRLVLQSLFILMPWKFAFGS